MSKDNGGPAFPHLAVMDTDENYEVQHNGMTLRDYFAAKAMAEVLHVAFAKGVTQDKESAHPIAMAAYMMADAMLKARAE